MRIVPVILRRKSRQSDPRLSVKVVASCRIPGKRKPVQLHLGYLSLMTEGGIAQGQRVKLLKNLRRKWLEHFHTEQVDIDWVVAERKLAERRAEVCDTREDHVKHEMSDGSSRPTRRLEPSTHVILFVAVNHRGGNPLKLGEECAEIQRELRMARNRDAFRFESRWAVSIDELMRHLTELDPTVVHFSGHGSGSIGLVLLDEQGQPTPVSGRALAMMVHAAARNVRLVLLNACYSSAQAEALAPRSTASSAWTAPSATTPRARSRSGSTARSAAAGRSAMPSPRASRPLRPSSCPTSSSRAACPATGSTPTRSSSERSRERARSEYADTSIGKAAAVSPVLAAWHMSRRSPPGVDDKRCGEGAAR